MPRGGLEYLDTLVAAQLVKVQRYSEPSSTCPDDADSRVLGWCTGQGPTEVFGKVTCIAAPRKSMVWVSVIK